MEIYNNPDTQDFLGNLDIFGKNDQSDKYEKEVIKNVTTSSIMLMNSYKKCL